MNVNQLQIIKSNCGRLSLTSGPACLNISEDAQVKKWDQLPYVNKDHQGTIVDFQLDLNKKVDILVCHDAPYGLSGRNDVAHQGLFGTKSKRRYADDGYISGYARCVWL